MRAFNAATANNVTLPPDHQGLSIAPLVMILQFDNVLSWDRRPDGRNFAKKTAAGLRSIG